MNQILGGLEGGATVSTLVLLDADGKVMTKTTGPGTNHFLLGMEECRQRIANMVNTVKKDIGMRQDQPLSALGLSLSGCEQEETNQELVRGLLENYPNLSERYAIGSDTEGSVAATSNHGGVCSIAGTGSNTLLINPDGSRVQCGGWGYLLGDEGGAYKIAHSAIKSCFDDLDRFSPAPHSIDKVWALIKDHFQIKVKEDLLEHYYTKFDKAFIASLCKKLSTLASEGDDAMAKYLFENAGRQIAQSLGAVIPKAAAELIDKPGGLHVLCVGSVWLSWPLLKPGFDKYMVEHTEISTITLTRLTTTLAVGAAYMAADKLNINIPRFYDENFRILDVFRRETFSNNFSGNNICVKI
nr:N-acetyl-D-glucosamine kinase isoform X1 [Onthophagus taurus]